MVEDRKDPKEQEDSKDGEGEISVEESSDGKFAFLKNKKFLLLIGVGLVLLLGVAIFFYRMGSSDKNPKIAKDMISNEWLGAIYSLEIVINLKTEESEGLKYIEVKIDLELDNDETVMELENKKSKIMDILLVFIGSKRADELNSIAEQNYLKRRIKELVNANLLSGRVVKVYFTKFKISQGTYINPLT